MHLLARNSIHRFSPGFTSRSPLHMSRPSFSSHPNCCLLPRCHIDNPPLITSGHAPSRSKATPHSNSKVFGVSLLPRTGICISFDQNWTQLKSHLFTCLRPAPSSPYLVILFTFVYLLWLGLAAGIACCAFLGSCLLCDMFEDCMRAMYL